MAKYGGKLVSSATEEPESTVTPVSTGGKYGGQLVPKETMSELISEMFPEPKPYSVGEALFPRMAKGKGTGLGKQSLAGLLDAVSLPFRAATTAAGGLGEELGYLTSGALPPEDHGEALLRRLGQIGKGESEGLVEGLGEAMGRDPANILMFAGPLLSAAKHAPLIAKTGSALTKVPGATKALQVAKPLTGAIGKGVQTPLAKRWLPSMGEGIFSAGMHQAENIADPEKKFSPLEAATEVGLSGLFPALGEVKDVLRKGSGASLRAQIPAAARKTTKEIEDIMDLATGRTPPGSAYSRVEDELFDFMTKQGKVPKGMTPMGHVKAIASEVIDPIVTPIANLSKAWTKKGTIKILQKKTKELEGLKKELFEIQDKAVKESGQYTNLEDLFIAAKNELDMSPRLTPHRKAINNAFNKAFDQLVADLPAQGKNLSELLPSDINRLKINWGKESDYITDFDEALGKMKTIANPDASISSIVYNTLYKQARQDIERGIGGEVIKQINQVEHEIIPFMDGLQDALVGQVGGFGKVLPLLGTGAAATVGGYGMMQGEPLAAIPTFALAMASGLYSRNMPFGRSIHQASRMIPDFTKSVWYEPTTQGVRSALFGPEDEDPEMETIRRRLTE